MHSTDALKGLLFALADDELIMGHRASEWTGLGPILEADLALSSIAQDEMGHALLFFQALGGLGEADADTLVFQRAAKQFRNAIFCELPRGDWGATLVRHFLYDLAEQIRLDALQRSSFQPLAEIARKIRSEEQYHLLHGRTWLSRLAGGTEESRQRLQQAIDRLLPYAAGLWEALPGEALLVAEGMMPPSAELRASWNQAVSAAFGESFSLPQMEELEPVEGGRRGAHSEHLASLLDALQLLHRAVPGARW